MMTDYYDGVDSDDVVYGDDVYDYLVSHLDDLCICHWLFALITLNSFQHRDGFPMEMGDTKLLWRWWCKAAVRLLLPLLYRNPFAFIPA